MPSPFIKYIENEQHYTEVHFKLMIFDSEMAKMFHLEKKKSFVSICG